MEKGAEANWQIFCKTSIQPAPQATIFESLEKARIIKWGEGKLHQRRACHAFIFGRRLSLFIARWARPSRGADSVVKGDRIGRAVGTNIKSAILCLGSNPGNPSIGRRTKDSNQQASRKLNAKLNGRTHPATGKQEALMRCGG